MQPSNPDGANGNTGPGECVSAMLQVFRRIGASLCRAASPTPLPGEPVSRPPSFAALGPRLTRPGTPTDLLGMASHWRTSWTSWRDTSGAVGLCDAAMRLGRATVHRGGGSAVPRVGPMSRSTSHRRPRDSAASMVCGVRTPVASVSRPPSSRRYRSNPVAAAIDPTRRRIGARPRERHPPVWPSGASTGLDSGDPR